MRDFFALKTVLRTKCSGGSFFCRLTERRLAAASAFHAAEMILYQRPVRQERQKVKSPESSKYSREVVSRTIRPFHAEIPEGISQT